MLTQICQYLRNWFTRDMYIGDFKIENGTLSFADGSAVPLVSGQYFRIVNSLFNDGVHKLGAVGDKLADEAWNGAVWSMAVPPVVVTLADDIAEWVEANQGAINSPYASESFGGYSYSVRGASGAQGGEAGAVTWQNQFAAALVPWRKI